MWSIGRALSLFIMEFIEKDVYRDASGLYQGRRNRGGQGGSLAPQDFSKFNKVEV